MKTKITFITFLLLSSLLFSGCQSKKKQGQLLQEEVNAMKQIELRSENIENSEDAFIVMRDLNKTLQDIREAILTLEKDYHAASENEKQQLESKFKSANSEIDQSLNVISNNIESYKGDERVSKMLDKLKEIMISK
jgi:ribosomal protein S20